MHVNTDLPSLSPTGWAGSIALTLIRLAKTDKTRLTLPFVAWLLIVLLVNVIGPIAFLAAGRRPAPVPEPAPRPEGDSATAHAVNVLYGARHD